MEIKTFKAIYPNLELIASPDAFFSTVKHRYPEYFDTGFFEHSSEDAFFIHKVVTENQTHIGFMACISVKDYENGKIKIHEHTLASKEQKSMELLLQRKAMIKPLLLTYPSKSSLYDRMIELTEKKKPHMHLSFEYPQEEHIVWSISDKQEIDAFKLLVSEQIECVYVADGHHRARVISHLNSMKPSVKNPLNFSQLFCSFFAFDQLGVSEFNRVVEILEEISPTRLIALLSQVFNIKTIEKGRKPRKKHELIAYIHREWYELTWKDRILAKYSNEDVILDTVLLNNEVLSTLLGIVDVKVDDRIEYVNGDKGIASVVKKCIDHSHKVGFFLYPVSVAEFKKISDNGQVLPPKSTYFSPRMKNGLITQSF